MMEQDYYQLDVQYSATCQDCLMVLEVSSDADTPMKAAEELREAGWVQTPRGWICDSHDSRKLGA